MTPSVESELETDENATRMLGDWNRYYGGEFDTPTDVVRDFLGIDASPGMVLAVTHRYVEAINRALNDEGVWLRGVVFYAELRAVDTSEDMIIQAMDAVDLGGIVDQVEADRAAVAKATDREGVSE